MPRSASWPQPRRARATRSTTSPAPVVEPHAVVMADHRRPSPPLVQSSQVSGAAVPSGASRSGCRGGSACRRGRSRPRPSRRARSALVMLLPRRAAPPTSSAISSPLALCHGPSPMRSRALTAAWSRGRRARSGRRRRPPRPGRAMASAPASPPRSAPLPGFCAGHEEAHGRVLGGRAAGGAGEDDGREAGPWSHPVVSPAFFGASEGTAAPCRAGTRVRDPAALSCGACSRCGRSTRRARGRAR